jgi:hypothetical protein
MADNVGTVAAAPAGALHTFRMLGDDAKTLLITDGGRASAFPCRSKWPGRRAFGALRRLLYRRPDLRRVNHCPTRGAWWHSHQAHPAGGSIR